MKQFALILVVGILVIWIDRVHAESDGKGEKRELLAEHETLSTFDGITYHRCMGLTAICPDRCGVSGEYVTFTVVKYLRYEQHGKYGGKQKSFKIQVSDSHKKPKGNPEILKTVRNLKKGDFVELWWRHDYVTKDRVSSPERPVIKLEKVDNNPDSGDSQ